MSKEHVIANGTSRIAFLEAYIKELEAKLENTEWHLGNEATLHAEAAKQLEESDESELKALARAGEAEAQLDAICSGFVDGNCTETYINIAGLIKQALGDK